MPAEPTPSSAAAVEDSLALQRLASRVEIVPFAMDPQRPTQVDSERVLAEGVLVMHGCHPSNQPTDLRSAGQRLYLGVRNDPNTVGRLVDVGAGRVLLSALAKAGEVLDRDLLAELSESRSGQRSVVNLDRATEPSVAEPRRGVSQIEI